MPYTPPTQQSPAASGTQSPAHSRHNSHVKSTHHGPAKSHNTGSRPGLSRSSSSTSYLSRERRSPSFQQHLTPDATPIDEELSADSVLSLTGSLRHRSPPIADSSFGDNTVMSPPDSAQGSSDDEQTERGRARELDLEKLKDAVSAISMDRHGSPEMEPENGGKPKLALDLSSTSPRPRFLGLTSPPLTKEARKISHSRSNTDSAVLDLSRQSSESPSSESDVDDERMKKPPMLRKKSGELVRPALRPPSARRRPSSMPGTPTYSKAVHFDNNLEHVRHFLQVDRPLAVSAGSSPVDLHDGETEFPFNYEDNQSREPPWQWELRTPNFPHAAINRSHLPVRVERVFVSPDNKTLIGTVAVHNLAFHKSIVARFTLDYWKTTSEVSADYSHDIRRKPVEDNSDRFNFNIKLEDQTNLESKTLFFCVRYVVNGQEFWDSNGGVNFQVDFSKKALPQKGKSGSHGNASKPLGTQARGRHSPAASGRPRPMSMISFDDFAYGFDSPFALESPPTATSLVGEKPLRFRGKGSGNTVPDAPGVRTKSQPQAFGTRYDFGASLSAAVQGGNFAESPISSPNLFPGSGPAQGKVTSQGSEQPAASADTQKPAALVEKPSLQSHSYDELIDKYCFFGSAKSSPPGSARPGNGQVDGSGDRSSPTLGTHGTPASPPVDLLTSALNHIVEEQKSAASSSRTSRAASPSLKPALGSRVKPSASYGYLFHQSRNGGLFEEALAPTAIQG